MIPTPKTKSPLAKSLKAKVVNIILGCGLIDFDAYEFLLRTIRNKVLNIIIAKVEATIIIPLSKVLVNKDAFLQTTIHLLTLLGNYHLLNLFCRNIKNIKWQVKVQKNKERKMWGIINCCSRKNDSKLPQTFVLHNQNFRKCFSVKS